MNRQMKPQVNVKMWKESSYYTAMAATVRSLPRHIKKFRFRAIFTHGETNQTVIKRGKLLEMLDGLAALPDQ